MHPHLHAPESVKERKKKLKKFKFRFFSFKETEKQMIQENLQVRSIYLFIYLPIHIISGSLMQMPLVDSRPTHQALTSQLL